MENELSNILKNEFVDYENSFVADMRIIDILDKALLNIEACKNLTCLQKNRTKSSLLNFRL